MSEITISTAKIRLDIEENLDHAQLTLESQNSKRARWGIVAVVRALTLAELMERHQTQLTSPERSFFAEKADQCAKLLSAFWEDFGLVLLKSATTGQEVIVHADPQPPAKHIAPKPRPQPAVNRPMPNGDGHDKDNRGRRIDPFVKQHILENLTPPAGCSQGAWFSQLAEEYGISSKTVWNWYAARRDDNTPAN